MQEIKDRLLLLLSDFSNKSTSYYLWRFAQEMNITKREMQSLEKKYGLVTALPSLMIHEEFKHLKLNYYLVDECLTEILIEKGLTQISDTSVSVQRLLLAEAKETAESILKEITRE